jgi:peptide/nickel transport system permease protein
MSVAAGESAAVLPTGLPPQIESPAGRRSSRVLVSLGMVLAFGPLILGLILHLFVSRHGLAIFASTPSRSPSGAHLFGTDGEGRDLLTEMVYGVGPTYEIAFMAGAVGLVLGTFLGLVSGYVGGWADALIRGITDVMLAVPPFAMVVVVAALFGTLSIPWLGFLIAVLSWALPARAMRSQVLSLREQGFVVMNRLTNRGSFTIMFGEILPNMLPYVMSTFVGLVSSGLLTAIGLELLGLGPVGVNDLGTTLGSAITYGAVSQGLWWWWVPPAAVLVLLFLGLFMISLTIDRISNPRLGGRHG